MSIPILSDDDVQNSLEMRDAVGVMERAFEKLAAGTLSAPARVNIDLGVGELAFTAGGDEVEGCVGFRVYDMQQLNAPQRGELTVVFDTHTGAVKGLAAGPLLGAMRTGAIGGVAVKHLSKESSKTLGIIGTGVQARTQLQAAVTVREFTTINVHSRSEKNRTTFAAEMGAKLGREITVCDRPQQLVESADVLICATKSPQPVINAEWLRPGVHISTIGPKFKQARELDLDVAARADLIATDSLAQTTAFGESFVLHDTEFSASLISLGDIIGGGHSGGRSETDITLFYSVGLAGTEVLLADWLLDQIA